MALDPGSCPAERCFGQKAWLLPKAPPSAAAGHLRVPSCLARHATAPFLSIPRDLESAARGVWPFATRITIIPRLCPPAERKYLSDKAKLAAGAAFCRG